MKESPQEKAWRTIKRKKRIRRAIAKKVKPHERGAKVENKFERWMEGRGYKIQRLAKGIPDYIIYKGRKCFLAEVKSGRHKFHKHQKETSKLLKKLLGVRTKVYRYKNRKFEIEKRI